MRGDDFFNNTIISNGTQVTGTIDAAGFTRLDGALRGDLSAAGRVVLGDRARMKGNLSGTTITVGGVIQGNVMASERLIVLGNALVMGDVITRRIQADHGCMIHGRVTVCQTEEAWQQALADFRGMAEIRKALAFRAGPPLSVPAAPAPVENGADL